MPGAELRSDIWICEYISPWDVYQHGVTRILASAQTRYQEMYIVESGQYGKALVLDGKWQSSSVDEFLYHEALVHPAMIFHGSPRRVLVLGGGEGATVREILRWNSVERATMVDIDGEVVDACREHLPEMHQGALDDSRTEVIIGDALELLDGTDERWDVVISDLSDPIEDGPSYRLFTREYFEKIRRVLQPEGTFVVQAGPVSPAENRLHARLVRTVRSVFENVVSYASFVPTYGSPWGFAVASSGALDTLPDPERVDELLAGATSGGFKLVDGRTLLGLLQTPLYLRRAIEADDSIYTLEAPPRFFGSGSSS
jgi:spermidine synthase